VRLPAEALAVTNLGDGLQPNSRPCWRHPDLVVLPLGAERRCGRATSRPRDYTAQLATDRLADVPRHARALGTLLGRAELADSLAARLARELAGVDAADAGGPSVLILAWDQPPIAIGAGSFLSELVERAGGRNLFADLPSASAPVSPPSRRAIPPGPRRGNRLLAAAGGRWCARYASGDSCAQGSNPVAQSEEPSRTNARHCPKPGSGHTMTATRL
jgi:hypothetical protein